MGIPRTMMGVAHHAKSKMAFGAKEEALLPGTSALQWPLSESRKPQSRMRLFCCFSSTNLFSSQVGLFSHSLDFTLHSIQVKADKGIELSVAFASGEDSLTGLQSTILLQLTPLTSVPLNSVSLLPHS